MRRLETCIPPPVVLLAAASLALLGAWAVPSLEFPFPWHAHFGLVAGVFGLMLNLWPKRAFRRARTTVNPMRPELATDLVVTGLYRHTRNPMYLGHALILMGWFFYLHNITALIALMLYVTYVTRFQIIPEERMLAGQFPVQYENFKRRVRRWL